MPKLDPTRPYSIPGFRIALVREPGVKLASKPQVRFPSEAAPMIAQYIGESDRRLTVDTRRRTPFSWQRVVPTLAP
jgi:hypothetical protein